MKQRIPAAYDRRKDPARNLPPAANEELPQDKELHELWQDKYLHKALGNKRGRRM